MWNIYFFDIDMTVEKQNIAIVHFSGSYEGNLVSLFWARG